MKTTKMFVAAIFVIAAITFFAGCGKSEDQSNHDMSGSSMQVDSTHVHSYDADVASLDVNNDGSVYQCPMHWNVISDDSGSCPLCMMDLEQYSVADAQKNLNENKPE